MQSNYVKGKVIVITGASSGFGKLASEQLAEKGGKVVLAARSEDKLKSIVDGIVEKGGDARYIVTDMTKRDDVNKMVQFALEEYDQIDILVNNAGIMPLAFFDDHEKAWEQWDQCIDLNMKGVIYGISAVYDTMMEKGQGQIINLSSIYGNYPVVGAGVYQATKVGVRYITESFRQETQGKIKTTIIRPTGIGGTGLANTVVNGEAIIGLTGINTQRYFEHAQMASEDKLPKEMQDINSPKYWAISPQAIADAIVYVIDQPWGVNISDITVRATGEDYLI